MENTTINDIRLSPHLTSSSEAALSHSSEVGGVRNSQHLLGQAADICPKDPQQFQRLVDFLRTCDYTDQLLTGPGWLHISWTPFAEPRHYVRLGYYK